MCSNVKGTHKERPKVDEKNHSLASNSGSVILGSQPAWENLAKVQIRTLKLQNKQKPPDSNLWSIGCNSTFTKVSKYKQVGDAPKD